MKMFNYSNKALEPLIEEKIKYCCKRINYYISNNISVINRNLKIDKFVVEMKKQFLDRRIFFDSNGTLSVDKIFEYLKLNHSNFNFIKRFFTLIGLHENLLNLVKSNFAYSAVELFNRISIFDNCPKVKRSIVFGEKKYFIHVNNTSLSISYDEVSDYFEWFSINENMKITTCQLIYKYV